MGFCMLASSYENKGLVMPGFDIPKEYFRNNDNYTVSYNTKYSGWAPVCQNCNKLGCVGHYLACANTPVFNVIDHGPEIVSSFGHCDAFEFNEDHNGKPAYIPLIKRFILFANGFYWER